MSTSIDIFFLPPSPPSRAALLLIQALGLLPNIKITDISKGEQLKPEFLKMNPLHTIPVINDNGFVLYDSHVIMSYLVDKYGKDDSLYPKDLQKRAIVNQKLFYDSIYLFPRFGQWALPPITTGNPASEEAKKKLDESMGHLNMFLEGNKWIAGDQMTIADFSIVSVISTMEACGYDFSPYPNLKDWFQRAQEAMASIGYNDVMKNGADIFGGLYKSKVKA